MFSVFKQKSNTEAHHTDLGDTEQKTPRTGTVLLVVMFITSLFFGWRALDDLQDVPAKPEFLSACAASFVSYGWGDSGRYNTDYYAPYVPSSYEPYAPIQKQTPECVFSALEVFYGIPQLFEKRKGQDVELQNLSLQLQQTENSIQDYERQYNLGLQENISNEQKKLYSIPDIQKNLAALRQTDIDLQNRIGALRAELKPLDEEMRSVYSNVLMDYRRSWAWHDFKTFLLELLFVFPFFWFTFRTYRRLLFKKSPYTVIWTALLGVSSVLLARVLLVWFWDLFLARVLETIWTYIQSVALLKSLVLYGGMALSIGIFGGAVYMLQKHIFDPRRVAVRNLKNNKCPTCEVSLDLSDEFCPNCGRYIREKCAVCGKERFVDLPNCPHCGSKK